MKTLLFRNTAWFLVLSFCLTQVAPAGFSVERARPVEEPLRVSGVVDALAKPVVQPNTAPTQSQPTGFVDSTAFQLNKNPLSPATPEPKPELIPTTPPIMIPVGKLPAPKATLNPELIPYTPPIMIDLNKAVPAPVKIVTDPAAGKEISVSINDRGIATVKWGDQEYKGYFDARTNSVILITNDDTIWTLQFAAKEDGSLYLQSFHSSFWSTGRSSDETYTFSAQGLLIRKDWTNEITMETLGYSGGWWNSTLRSGGTIDYAQINGKTLVSHEKSWNESARPYSFGSRTDTEAWYSYDNQGNLAAKSWERKDSYSDSFGQENYVQINGKTLLSSSKVWQYNENRLRAYDVGGPVPLPDPKTEDDSVRVIINPIDIVSPVFLYVSTHTETFYSYDAEGNLVSEMSAVEGYDYNNVRHATGTLWLHDAVKNTWTFVAADGIDPFAVWFRQDASGIKALAQKMTVYVGERDNPSQRVEYTRNPNGTMTAKAVYDNSGNVTIVQGEPDVLSGETNDITFQNGQEVNGYYAYYGEYWHDAVNDGYRLIFYDASWNIAAAVDFPAQKTVILNGVENKISIDPNGNILLESTIPPAVVAIQQAVKLGLSNTFGFSQALLDQLIKDGKIVIKVDLENLTATITIDPSVTLPAGVVNLTDPLGLATLPQTIKYQLAVAQSFEEVCQIGGDCVRLDHYYLKSASFQAGKLYFQLNYIPDEGSIGVTPEMPFVGDNRLHFVQIFVGDPTPVCDGAQCTAALPMKVISYEFSEDASTVKAHIVYNMVSDEVRTRDIEITNAMGDGQYHIQTVTDKDAAGNVLAVNQFGYWVAVTSNICLEGSVCPPGPVVVGLFRIVRTDAQGKLLSEINSLYENGGVITLPDGSSRDATFQTIEELLGLARQFEQEKTLPPAVQEYVDALKTQLGDKFLVKATLQTDGMYLVRVEGVKSPCSKGAICENMLLLGGFSSVEYSLTQEGILNRDSVKAVYNGVDVDGKLLLDAMGALEASFHPVGAAWMMAPPYYYARLVTLMSQIVVKESGADLLRFDHQGKRYKAYRDAAGNIQLEGVIPPAVQAFVNDLQEKIGPAYTVTAVLQADGTYRIALTDALGYLGTLPPVGRMHQMSFAIRLEPIGATNSVPPQILWGKPQIDLATLQVAYYGANGDVAVDTKLLFGAMEQLYPLPQLAYCSGEGCVVNPGTTAVNWAALVGMTRITVTKVDADGVIHFTEAEMNGGKSYKCAWNAEGKVVLTDVTLEVKAIAAVKADLAKTLGLNEGGVDAVIESIIVDGNSVSVLLKTGNMGIGHLINVLGSSSLPTSVVYTLGADGKVVSSIIRWQENNSAVLKATVSYSADGLISEIDWVRDSSDLRGVLTALMGKDVYTYANDTISIKHYSAAVLIGDPSNGLLQEILLTKMEDGKFHTSEVKKYSNGQLVDVSRFDYVVSTIEDMCLEGSVCPPAPVYVLLSRIVRTDAQGKLLSEISSLFENGGVITLSNGISKEVTFQTIEELLDLARQLEQAHAAVVAAVKADLAKTMGLDPKALDAMIESISYENGRVTVTFKAGVMGDSRLIAPLGTNSLPKQALITLGENDQILRADMSWDVPFHLLSGHVTYENGRMVRVDWDSVPTWICIPGDACPPKLTALIGYDVYNYTDTAIQISRFSYAVVIGDPTNGLQRETVLKLIDDGKYHVSEVRQYENGSLKDVSKFTYAMWGTACQVGQPCEPQSGVFLDSITRTDANGNLLSEISVRGNNALITLPGGKMSEVAFTSLEELIDQARAFEVANAISPVVQALLDQLKINQYFRVNAELVQGSVPTRYQFTVTNTFPCTDEYCMASFPAQGAFSNMVFMVSAEGVVDAASIDIRFYLDPIKGNTFQVDGNMLFEGLKSLAQKNDVPVEIQVLRLMEQIIVTAGTESGTIRFIKDRTAYKVFRDESENVLLARDIPGLPDNQYVVYLDAVAAHFGISVDAIVSFQKYEAMNVCLGTGCPTWALDVELTVMVSGQKTLLSGVVEGPAWDVPVTLASAQKPVSAAVSREESSVSSGSTNESMILSPSRWMLTAYRPMSRNLRSFASVSSLGSVASLLRESTPLAVAQGFGTSAIFGFEQGSILFSRLLTELTR